jgi:hypothetical protein
MFKNFAELIAFHLDAQGRAAMDRSQRPSAVIARSPCDEATQGRVTWPLVGFAFGSQ